MQLNVEDLKINI